MAKTTIFYKIRNDLHVQVNPAEVESFPGGEGDDRVMVTIRPGPNRIEEDLWDHIKQKDAIRARIDAEKLVEKEPTKQMLMSLQGPVDRDLIGVLSPKAREVPDLPNFDAEGATSQEGRLKKLEDQLEEFKRDMPHVGRS